MSPARGPRSSKPSGLFALAVLAAGCQRGGEASLPRPPEAPQPNASSAETPRVNASSGRAVSPEAATYRLGARVVTLRDGRHDEPAAPGSAARDTTIVWGTPLAADLDGDGDQDAVVILESRPGGSGTFYYVAAAVLDAGTYTGSSGVLLGDRIAPQRVTFADGVVTVEFADRRPGEPMSTSPSVGMSRRFAYRDGELQPVGDGKSQPTGGGETGLRP